jgi:hypothetical protein
MNKTPHRLDRLCPHRATRREDHDFRGSSRFDLSVASLRIAWSTAIARSFSEYVLYHSHRIFFEPPIRVRRKQQLLGNRHLSVPFSHLSRPPRRILFNAPIVVLLAERGHRSVVVFADTKALHNFRRDLLDRISLTDHGRHVHGLYVAVDVVKVEQIRIVLDAKETAKISLDVADEHSAYFSVSPYPLFEPCVM